MWGLQFWFCLENCTLIIAATIPTLRPLFTRNRGDTKATPYTREPNSYQRWPTLRSKSKTATGGDAWTSEHFDDQIELTGANQGKYTVGCETECVADTRMDKRSERVDVLPKGGIVKTMNTYVEEG
jgi:hypothetical protein